MNLVKSHPFNESLYHGRAEPFESDRACYWHELVSDYQSQAIGLVGFSCDQGVRRNQGRVGAKHAPDFIRQAFGKLPCSVALLNTFGTDRKGELAKLIGDIGNIECVDNDELTADSLEQTHQVYAKAVAKILDQDGFAIGLGGGHAISYGSFLGLWQHLCGKALSQETANQSNKNVQQVNVNNKIGVINFDAHLDIRQSDVATSGTPFRQISEHLCAASSDSKTGCLNLNNENQDNQFNYLCIGVSEFGNTPSLFDRAEKLNVQMVFDDECYRLPFEMIAQRINQFIEQVDIIYLTIDMDCFAAGIVPAVSATAAKGLTLDFVERCIEQILDSGKVKLADLAEINPQFDRDGLSAKVTARLVAKIVNQVLLSKLTNN